MSIKLKEMTEYERILYILERYDQGSNNGHILILAHHTHNLVSDLMELNQLLEQKLKQ